MAGTALRGPVSSWRAWRAWLLRWPSTSGNYCPQPSLGWGARQLTGQDAQSGDGYDLAKSRRGSSL